MTSRNSWKVMIDITDSIFIFGAKYSYLFVIVISFLWFLAQPKPRQKEILILACAYLPLALVISVAASRLYYSPRPFVLGNFEPLIPHKANNGFPSHHMLLVSAPAALIFIFSRRAGLILWALAAFTGFSRIYAGLHHTIDVAGSALIAIISLSLAYFFVSYLKNPKPKIFCKG